MNFLSKSLRIITVGLLVTTDESLWTDNNDVLGSGLSLVNCLLTLVQGFGGVGVFDVMSHSAKINCCTLPLKKFYFDLLVHSYLLVHLFLHLMVLIIKYDST